MCIFHPNLHNYANEHNIIMQIRAKYAIFLINPWTKICFIYQRITVVSFKILLQSEVKCIFGVFMQSTSNQHA